MKRGVVCLVMLVCAVFLCQKSAYSAGLFELADQLYIKNVVAFQVVKEKRPVINVLVTLRNDSDRLVTLKNGEFEVVFNSQNVTFDNQFSKRCGSLSDKDFFTVEEKKCWLGTGRSMNKSLSPSQALNLGQARVADGNKESTQTPFGGSLKSLDLVPGNDTVTILELRLPQSGPAREAMLIRLLNYLGMPDAQKRITMKGKAKLGVELKRGMHSQEMDVELYYVPKLQSSVLFE